MGFFKKLFGGNDAGNDKIAAALTGKIVNIENVPDQVFSQKMMGDGIAIEPTEGKVVAPMNATVETIFPTKHAIGLKGENGIELLIHVGLDTVNLKGEGFTAHVQAGDKVKAGDVLVEFDLDYIRANAPSTITPIIVTNHDQFVLSDRPAEGTAVVAGDTELFKAKHK
ncbi:PTS sugar transporter subunit IIA [Exiguobacterium flavidum]|uniref:PTS sugar transporter subunit IIA n=1 Tax=Exiguobacterium flavidum TaxID=2184695 RepID=UPI000DF76CA8|nr:PTS glucose transporter subunit IIA [Exiguobacterium flavidum]